MIDESDNLHAESGFVDRSFEPIHLGDVVQLHIPGSEQSDTLYVIQMRGDQIGLFVAGTENDPAIPGVAVTKELAALSVVVDCKAIS